MGTLVTVSQDPVRVAEEYATADVISRGRLEIGFVKSGGTEMASGNANPIGVRERFWEAIDLIGKTLTTHDGPFSWEGKHFTHRHVNIWPRPLSGPASADVGGDFGPERHRRTRPARHGQYHGHARGRGHQARLGLLSPSAGRGRVCQSRRPTAFGYSAFVYVGDTDEEAVRVGSQALVVCQHQHEIGAAIRQVPAGPDAGRIRPAALPQPCSGRPVSGGPGATSALNRPGVTAEMAMAGGRMYAGNPDTVYKQIMEFYDKVGGFGHLIMVGKTGFITHDEAVKNITLFSKGGPAAPARD